MRVLLHSFENLSIFYSFENLSTFLKITLPSAFYAYKKSSTNYSWCTGVLLAECWLIVDSNTKLSLHSTHWRLMCHIRHTFKVMCHIRHDILTMTC